MSNDLWTGLTESAASHATSLHCWVGDRYEAAPWSAVVSDAESMTAGLRGAGVRPGARVATILTNGPYAVRGLLAAWLAGAAVASLPVPARGMDAAEYRDQLLAIQRNLRPELFLVEARLLDLVPEEVRRVVPVRTWESFAGSGRVGATPPGDDEVAFIQYSSGSTSTPKGCMLTPRAIAQQVGMLSRLIEPDPARDVTVTWLPLSHDMGVFGSLLTSWWSGVEMYLSTPERFMFSPGTWFSDMATVGGTMTVGTNTALYLAARAASRSAAMAKGLRVRVCIVGAERVEVETLRYVTDTLGRFGFRDNAFMPAYGLAEATLAVTATRAGEAPRSLSVDAVALADGDIVDVEPDDPVATGIVGAGTPCEGVELTGVADGLLAEIGVRSPSLALGYHGDERQTRDRFRDGVLLTSDLGFLRDGHLYPVGRADDVISVAGRKVYAREIENAIEGIDGVRRGCSTLISRKDGARTRLTLIIEPRNSRVDYRALAESAGAVAMAKGAVALDECVFLGRNDLPKTPTGKIQRHRCRHLLESGGFDPLATVELGAP
jgi:fatty-acyl-CoA synthase